MDTTGDKLRKNVVIWLIARLERKMTFYESFLETNEHGNGDAVFSQILGIVISQ